ncbi:Thymidylate synthase, variant 2 [Clonorchis sinensis]|uniref:Thymidylate synthase n=1 Tax=Clonorchis sinensis TaxID=79923 RepID=A0A8T1MEH1_CLOSI|nr:Thymidylate synthase, variant 2 [Clonorchis sinensis]
MDQDAVTNGDKQETESPATLPPTIPYFPDHIYGEAAYLNLLRHILCHGVERSDRTGTGTLAVFGPQMRFSLRDDSFPLLTTKQVFFRGIVEELLWFIRGSTDSNELAARKVHFWDANGSREFLDNLGFTERKEGDLGPVYGFQWRHSGADYIDCDTDYTGQGVDQLAEVIRLIRERPWDRRILIVAWNVRDLKLMALPPCHCLVQFFVANGELSCQLYQRSGDMVSKPTVPPAFCPLPQSQTFLFTGSLLGIGYPVQHRKLLPPDLHDCAPNWT